MPPNPPTTNLAIRIVAVDPPGNCYGAARPILLGTQRNKDVEQIGLATETAEFLLDIGVVSTPDGFDFKGPYVHGRKGDRVLYLSWGVEQAGEGFEMFARAKLKFEDLGPELLVAALALDEPSLTCTMQATNEKGHPASGTIRPPRLAWSA